MSIHGFAEWLKSNAPFVALATGVVGYFAKAVVDGLRGRSQRRRADRAYFRDRRLDTVVDFSEIMQEMEAKRESVIEDYIESADWGDQEEELGDVLNWGLRDLRARSNRPLASLQILSPNLYQAARAWRDVTLSAEDPPQPRESYAELLILATRRELGDTVTPEESAKERRLSRDILGGVLGASAGALGGPIADIGMALGQLVRSRPGPPGKPDA